MTHQNLRLGKCWKLFRATISSAEQRSFVNFAYLPAAVNGKGALLAGMDNCYYY